MLNVLNLFEQEIEDSKNDLRKAYREKDFYKTLCMLRFLTSSLYVTNYTFCDNELESITAEAFKTYLGNTYIEDENKDCIVFYDGFGLLERGLAKIYIEALLETGKNVIWILYDYLPEVNLIQQAYKDIERLSIEIIPKKTIIDRIHILKELIEKYSPKYLFIYTTPYDVVGVGTLSTIRGNIIRYLINLTDHAFWIGKCALDYVIEFRDIGCSISHLYRNIEEKKILKLPYYPPDRKAYEYEGMPFDEKYKFVFSGGSSYKIQGSDRYDQIVDYILSRYPDIRFVYACNNIDNKIQYWLNKYPNRFFCIKERKDLDSIMKKAKFYLSTYPIGGGLMIQYAAQNGCLPVSLVDKDNKIGDASTVLIESEDIDCIKTDIKDLFNVIDKILTDKDYYLEQKKRLKGHVILREEFNKNIEKLISECETNYNIKYCVLDVEMFRKVYLDRFTYDAFKNMIIDSRNKWVQGRHPDIMKEIPE